MNDSTRKQFTKQVFRVFKPNLGVLRETHTLSMLKKYKKINPAEAEKHWKEVYDLALTMCGHEIFFGRCRRRAMTIGCDKGNRKKEHYVLSGEILSVWDMFEKKHTGQSKVKMEVVRLKTADKLNVIGESCARFFSFC